MEWYILAGLLVIIVIAALCRSILYSRTKTTRTDQYNEDLVDRLVNRVDKKGAAEKHAELERIRENSDHPEKIDEIMKNTGK